MKLIFASDIHGSSYYANLLIEEYKKEKADKLILLGDVLYHGPRNALPKDYQPMEVVNLLNQYKDEIICVRGNCDSEVDQMVLEFPIMASYTQLVVDNFTFFLTHGHLFEASNFNKGNNFIYVYGHTHIPVVEKKDIVILNPGSIALAKNDMPNSYAIYENRKIIIKTFDNKVIKELVL